VTEQPDTPTLRDHPAVAKVCVDLAATQRACYGKQLDPFDCGDCRLHVSFEDVTARQVEMQWRVRCAGFDFELQFVEPAALLDLGSALSPAVPLTLQRAAVLHAASDVLQAVEERLGARIELIGLSGSAPAWGRSRALGLNVQRTGNVPDHRPRRSAVFLRAMHPEGWQQLHRAAQRMRMQPLPATHDVRVDLTLLAPPISLGVAVLRRLEAGDVLLLDAPAGDRHRLGVAFKVGSQPLPGVRGTLTEGRVRITQPATDPAVITTPSQTPATERRDPLWSKPMNPEESHPNHPLDNVLVEIEFELGRLALPLSELRSLAVGQVFETRHVIDEDGVVLWCGGQRLGVGRLVTIGERLGVRVAALQGAVRDGAVGATPEHG
jgi:type III secretion system YscQ/HrcQ family protein